MQLVKFPTSPSLWLFTMSLVLAPLSDLRVIGNISFCDLFLVLAAVSALVERLIYKESLALLTVYFFIAAAFVLRYLIGVFQGDVQYLIPFLIVLIATAITPLAVSFMRVNRIEEFNFLFLAWTLGGVIGVFFIIGFCNGLFPGHEDKFWYYHNRARGLTPHPNTSGISAVLTLPGLFFLFSHYKRFMPRALLVVLILATLKAVDYSGARSALVASIVFIFIWAILNLLTLRRFAAISNKQVTAWLISAAFGLLVVSAYILLGGKLDVLSNVWERMFGFDPMAIHSNWERGVLNDIAWKGFLSSPLIGQGYRWTSFASPVVAHNMYLQYLQATGLLGFLAFITGLVYPLLYPLKAFLYSPDRNVAKLNNCILAAAAAVLVWLLAQSGFADYEAILIFCLPLILYVQRLYENSRGA